LTTISELAFEPLTSLAQGFAHHDFEPEDVLDSVVDNIHRKEKALHSFLYLVDEKSLRSEAQSASYKIRQGSAKKLAGLPFAVKDNTDVAGLPCTGGSKILRDNVPLKDAHSVSRMRKEGAIILGKTNLDEMAAFGIATNNPHYGRTFNPWDLTRIPGGSSGGSAAAVSAGEAVASTGTDTGGSVRIPASFCNLVGLKPTFGRVGRSGTISMCWSLDHFGFLTRTVRDAAFLLEIASGPDPHDSATIGSPEAASFIFQREPTLRGMKVGVFSNPISPSSDGVNGVFNKAIGKFSELGASTIDLALPDVDSMTPTIFAIALPEVAAYHEEWYKTKKDLYGEVLRGYVQLGHTVLATQYLKAQRAKTIILERVIQRLRDCDVLLVPTAPAIAPKLDQDTIQIGGRDYPAFQVLTENTYPFNLLGLPTMSIPAGFSDGMPVGLQIIATHWREDLIFKAGDAFQQVTDHHRRRPEIPA